MARLISRILNLKQKLFPVPGLERISRTLIVSPNVVKLNGSKGCARHVSIWWILGRVAAPRTREARESVPRGRGKRWRNRIRRHYACGDTSGKGIDPTGEGFTVRAGVERVNNKYTAYGDVRYSSMFDPISATSVVWFNPFFLLDWFANFSASMTVLM